MADILILDPESRVVEVLRKVLATAGHQVSTATEESAALDVLQSSNTDIVLADTECGMELLESLVDAPRRPVFIMTSLLPDKRTVLRALRAGAFRFLTKPVGLRVLQATVEEACAELERIDTAV